MRYGILKRIKTDEGATVDVDHCRTFKTRREASDACLVLTTMYEWVKAEVVEVEHERDGGSVTKQALDNLLERFDETAPELQRKVVAKLTLELAVAVALYASAARISVGLVLTELDAELDGVKIPASAAAIMNRVRHLLSEAI